MKQFERNLETNISNNNDSNINGNIHLVDENENNINKQYSSNSTLVLRITEEKNVNKEREPKEALSKVSVKNLNCSFKRNSSTNNIDTISKNNKLIAANSKDRNSLESINSKFSISSLNDDSLGSQTIKNNNEKSNIRKINKTKQSTNKDQQSSSQQINTTTTTSARPSSSNLPTSSPSPSSTSSASSSSSTTSSSSPSSSSPNEKCCAREHVSFSHNLDGNLKTWQDASSCGREKVGEATNNGHLCQNHQIDKATNISQIAMICLNGKAIDESTLDKVGKLNELSVSNISKGADCGEIVILEPTCRKVSQRKSASPYRSGSRASSRVSIVVPTVERNSGPPFMFAGIAASIIGSFFFSFGTVSVKLLPNPDSINEKAKALFFRGVFITMFCTITNCCKGTNFKVPRDEIWINAARAFFGTLGVFGSYCALTYISAGDSTAIMFSSPIWTSILSHFIFKEPLQWLQILALPASLFGIILIAHPALIITVDHQPTPLSNHHLLHIKQLDNITTAHHNNITQHQTIVDHQQQQQQHLMLPETTGTDAFGDWEQRWPGVVIALGVSLLISCTYIVLKFRRTTPIQTTTFWLGVCIIITSLCVMCAIGFGDIPDTTYEWSILFALGITSWLGQSCLQWAFLHEEAGILSIVRTLDVALTFAFSALLLDDEIYWTSIVGALIIGLVVVSIMLGNWIQKILCIGTAADNDSDNDGDGDETTNAKAITANMNVRDKIPKELISATTYTISKA